MILKVDNIHSYYGKSHILHGVSMELKKGKLTCLLGRNGVGKTTTMNSIMGITQPSSGSVVFNGKPVQGLPSYKVAKLGIGIVPETRRIFGSLTVQENLLIGQKRRADSDISDQDWNIDKIFDWFPILAKRRNNKGKNLSGGEQQLLTVARTLMGNPSVILVDEPTEGLAPLIVKDVMDMLGRIREAGVSILMVEQNFNAAVKVADWFYIMGKGKIVFEGDRKALLEAEETRKAYLEV